MKARMQYRSFLYITILIVLPLTVHGWAQPGLVFPGLAPGDGQSRITQDELILENDVIGCAWSIREG